VPGTENTNVGWKDYVMSFIIYAFRLTQQGGQSNRYRINGYGRI
jgi:hypothetical protein